MEKLVIKKNWNNAKIRLCLSFGELTIEVDIDDFIKRVIQLGSEIDPKPFRFAVTSSKIRSLVSETVGHIVTQALSELKQESIKIV